MIVTPHGYLGGQPAAPHIFDFCRAIWEAMGETMAITINELGRCCSFKVDGDDVGYACLERLSKAIGSTNINLTHQSGGPYSEVTPDLRPGEFTIFCYNIVLGESLGQVTP